ncbi:MAG: pitrilysin family protein [Saprospiraceae bacterium]|nr:pitrilysin family protein [Saprospiraceae bacterium]
MQKYSIYILFLGLFFVQCSKKTTEGMKETAVESVNTAESLAWRSSAPSAGPARPIELGEYTSFDLANGLKVIVVENHKIPRVSYQLSLNNDPIVEGDQAGYVSMAGNLMATGTTNRSKAEIDQAIDFIGASMNTSGGGVFGSSLKKHSNKLLEIMTDVLYNPSFPEDEFKKMKTQTLSGLANVRTNPDAMASNVASVLNYGKDHPYGEIQNESHVKNMTIEKCKSYYETYFKPNNAYLIIVGDVTPEEAKMDAEKYFGSWKSGDIPETTYAAPVPPTGRNVAFANKDGAVQSVIRITYPVNLMPGSEDLIKARVMNNILGGGIFSGRLMQNLREDKAYTYGARSSLSSDELVGNFNAFASVRNSVTDSSVIQFLYEMERLRDEPVSADDLQLVKNSMAGSFARSLESPQTIARFARNTYKFNLPKDYYQTYLQRLEAVQIEDVSAMAKKYIRPDNAYIIVAGSKDEVSENLKQFDTDGEIDFYDPFGKKLDMNESALPAGLDGKKVVSNYLEALGGMDKLNAVKTMVVNISMDIAGQKASMEMGQKDNTMFYSEMSMMGNIVQEQRFNGTRAKISGMGGIQEITKGPQFDALKDQAVTFGQVMYMNEGYEVNLKGIEEVEGENAYKVEVVKPNGNKSYEYYSVKSNLLIRNTTTQPGQGGEDTTIVTDLGDYKDVNGVQFPHTLTINGAMPFPLVMKVDSYTMNGEIPAEKF